MATLGLNVSTKDRGLHQCLTQSRVATTLINGLCDPTGFTRWETLEEFFYFFEADTLTAGITDLLAQYPDYKRSRDPDAPNHSYSRELSHLRQAWHTAQKVVKDKDAIPADQEVDWEAPLPQCTHDDLASRWTARYNFKVRPEFDPDKVTITRYFRALTKNTDAMKVVDMKTHKATGSTSGLVRSGGINTLYDWYVCARTMAYALAKAGNHVVNCKEKGPDTLMAPLDINQNYVEDAYEKGLARNSLTWLLERDKLTRTHMVTFLKEGYSQGVALTKAIEKSHFQWQDANLFKDRLKFTGAPVRLPDREDKRPRTPPRGKGLLPDGPKNPRGTPRKEEKGKGRGKARRTFDCEGRSRSRSRSREKERRSNIVPNAKGKKVCVQYSRTGKCNLGNKCKDLHNFCNRKLQNGGVCGQDHPSFRCSNPNRIRGDINDPRKRSPMPRNRG